MAKKNGVFIGVALSTVFLGVVFLTVLARAFFHAPQDAVGVVASPVFFEGEAPPEGHPLRLVIPSLGIDANIQPVGKNGRGEMAAPSNFSDVSWYREGTVPGEKGSAVMAGHVDNGIALEGVFKHLHELRKGDEFSVVTKGGATVRFIVSDVQSFHYKEVPLELLFLMKDKARLNLVTCDGAWISGERTYDRRLVVFGELLY